MAGYIARRLAWLPILLLCVTAITFTLGRYGPGDPVQILQGQYSNPEAVQRIRAQWGLDDPLPAQYARYVWNVLRGDLGESYKYRGRTVAELIGKKMAVSAQLGLAALIISVSLGIPLGLLAALQQGKGWDTALVSLALLGQSLPVFLTVPMLLLAFALKLQVLPSHGWGGFFSPHIVLPALVLGIPGVAIITRLTRASVMEVITLDYVRTARAKGLPERIVLTRHVLRNALIPVATTLGGSLSGLIAGAVIVEGFFGIPGVGSLAIESLFARDYPVIMALTLIGTTAFAISNLLVDLLYPVLDPRITLGGSQHGG